MSQLKLIIFLASLTLFTVFVSPPEHITRAQTEFDCSAVTEIATTQCEALVAFYTQLNGSGWENNTNWLQNTAPCTWYGINCAENVVDAIFLEENGLVGSLPAEISQLTDLGELHLSGNDLAGTLPSELAQLSKLRILDVRDNQLSGEIPAQLGVLPNLHVLRLGYNQFTGTVPDRLGNLTTLFELSVAGNPLSGDLPIACSNCENSTGSILAIPSCASHSMPSFKSGCFKFKISSRLGCSAKGVSLRLRVKSQTSKAIRSKM